MEMDWQEHWNKTKLLTEYKVVIKEAGRLISCVNLDVASLELLLSKENRGGWE